MHHNGAAQPHSETLTAALYTRFEELRDLESPDRALGARLKQWTGKDVESQRWVSFTMSVAVAREDTVGNASNRQQALEAMKLLGANLDSDLADEFREEAAKVMFSAETDVPRLTQLCHRAFGSEARMFERGALSADDVAAVLSMFLMLTVA